MLTKICKKPLRIFFRLVGLIFVSYILFFSYVIFFVSIESYNPIYPYIDTKFSSGFKEKDFDQIKIGDSTDVVESKLGSPIWKFGCGGCWDEQSYVNNDELRIPNDRTCNEPCNSKNQSWQFSDDGACLWWDFAWKNFTLIIQDNKVVDKQVWWLYD